AFVTTVTTSVTYDTGSNFAKNNGNNFLAQAKNVWIDFGASVISYFKSYQFKELLFTLKTISFIVSLILLLIIIYVFVKSTTLGKAVSQAKKAKTPKKKMFKRWVKIERRFNSGIEANYRLAILEADNLYDESLKILGYGAEKDLSNIDEIKKARRIKNQIIDNPNFKLTREDAAYSLIAYKRGLEELEIL
ncbi:MAG: hypothetical protein NT058_01090, partial [Candidatus Portnoybacteria bacterium]|nr:hypothetical protein [Candidatus Portnoybacteria bacterium]